MSSIPIPPSLTHLDASGEARMVDVGGKVVTAREAVAEARVRLGPVAYAAVRDATVTKGDVLGTARIAGILAAKRCAELIPLCHSLPLSFAGVDFELEPAGHSVRVRATCRTDHRTGVEMEAMTAASVAALTLYDMCKGVDKGIVIEAVRLLYKSGGKSGTWRAEGEPADGEPAGTAGVQAGPERAAGSTPPRPAAAGDLAVAQVPAAPLPGALSAGIQGAAPTQLVYFAQVAERTGCRQEIYPGPWPLSGAQLLAWLERRHPALAPASRLQLAINQQHARATDPIHPGDEVAVFEPVTGG